MKTYVKFGLIAMVAFTTMMVFGAEAAGVVPPTPDQPWYVQIVMVLVPLLLTTFVVPYLHKSTQAADEQVALLSSQKDLTDMQKRQLLSERLKSFLLRTAENRVQLDFPDIAKQIVSKQLNSVAAIKVELTKIGLEVKAEAITYFGNQGIDLVATVGDEALDGLIRWAADKVSPFPGKDTAVALLTDTVSNKLVDFGVNFFKDKVFSPDGSIVAVPATTVTTTITPAV